MIAWEHQLLECKLAYLIAQWKWFYLFKTVSIQLYVSDNLKETEALDAYKGWD